MSIDEIDKRIKEAKEKAGKDSVLVKVLKEKRKQILLTDKVVTK
jgi:hypothetical protein